MVAKCLIEKETITNADVTRLIGPRPFAPHKEYADYLSAGHDKPAVTPTPNPATATDKETNSNTDTPADAPVLAPV